MAAVDATSWPRALEQCELRVGCFKRQKLHEVFSGHVLAHDRPLVRGCGALGPPHGHTPSLQRIPDPVKRLLPPRHVSMHLPVGVKTKIEVYRPSYAARGTSLGVVDARSTLVRPL